ncbi:uncharacterized protein RBU33_027475 isoform 1-T1 [Hipposideros larvatus]
MRSPGPSRNAPGEGVSGKCAASELLLGFSCETSGGRFPTQVFPLRRLAATGQGGRKVGETPDSQGVQVRPSPSRTPPVSAWSPAEPKALSSPASSAPIALDLSTVLTLHSWLFPRDAARAMAGAPCPSLLREAEERCADSSARPGLYLCVLLGLQDVCATWTWSQTGEQGTWGEGRPPWCWLSRAAKNLD